MRFYNIQKIKFRHLLWCIFGISLFVVGGCAITTTYGTSPKQDISDRDIFTFKIFYNSYAQSQDIELKAKEEINKFMDEHGYEDFAVQNIDCAHFLEYCTYQVKFYASTQDSSTQVEYEKTKNISLVKTNPQNLMITGNTLVITEIGYDIVSKVDYKLSGNILVKNEGLSFDISLTQSSVETVNNEYPIVFNYEITNNSNEPIKVIWDEVAYVDNDGVAHGVIKSGVQLVDKAKKTKDVVIPPQSKVDEIVYPSDYIYNSSPGWRSKPVLENLGNGERATVFLPIQIGGETINYSFTFEAKEN